MVKWLGIILILSLLVRVIGLSKAPPELFGDEIDVGYQAYSLLKTGKDMYRQILPFYIHSLSEWRAPVLIYNTVPTIFAFGTNEWGVRLPEAIQGSLSGLIFALLIYSLSRNKRLSIVAGLLLATMPWHIHYSRSAFEVVAMLNFIMLGTITFLKKRYISSALLFVISIYTYSTAVFFVPVWGAFLLLRQKRISWKFVVASIIFLLPFIVSFATGVAGRRFGSVSIFSSSAEAEVSHSIRTTNNTFADKLIFNRWTSWGSAFFRNYVSSFSSEFLFIRGDPIFRHSSQYAGAILATTIPFFLLGMYLTIRHKNYFWLTWLLLAPVPAALTRDGGQHATRLFLMIPPLLMLTTTGVVWFYSRLSKWRTMFVVGMVALFCFEFFAIGYHYATIYRAKSWQWWHVGYKDAMTELAKISDQYDLVFINNTYEPALTRFLFWTKYSPQKFHEVFTLDKEKKNVTKGYDGFSLDGKYFFGTFDPFYRGESYMGRAIYKNNLYLVSHRDEIGGEKIDMRKQKLDDVDLLYTSTNLYNDPILYLVTSHEE